MEVTNRLKGLALVDRLPEELRTEVRNTAGGGDQNHPEQKEGRKAKRLSEEALPTAEKRREVKEKWETETYTHLNAEFQRTARRDKKAFLSDQCKEIEENKMEKTRDRLQEN